MKVCHVIESGATGALEMVFLMANVQREMGWEVLVVYSPRPGTPADLHHRVPAGTKLLRLRMSPMLPHLATWCLHFSRLLSKESPNIVHFHGSRAAFWGRLVAGRRYGSHAVHSPHCISLMYLNFPPARHALYRALEQIAYRVCPALYLACSELELLTIERKLNVKVRLLKNSVDEELLAAYLGAPAQNWTVFDGGGGGGG